MLTTAQEILTNLCGNIEQSEYAKCSKAMLTYPMSLGDFFTIREKWRDNTGFSAWRYMQDYLTRMRSQPQWQKLMDEKIRQAAQMKECAGDREQMHACRMRLKEIRECLEQIERDYEKKGYMEYCAHEGKTGCAVLVYKHRLVMNTMDNIACAVPALQKIKTRYPALWDMPVFTENIHELAKENLPQVALESGPCLYGTDEVFVSLYLHDTENVLIFDHDNGICIKGDCTLSLEDFLALHAEEIKDITFHSKKDGFSSQELEQMQIVFTMAEAMQCRLLLTLPDMSYRKQWFELSKHLPESLRENARNRYAKILYGITDLYLELIAWLKKQYQVPRIEILHERNQSAYKRFLRERQKYCSLSDVSTSQENKKTAIYDYICMPAAPLYLWGTEVVIEVNSTDEADSVRKCMKYHRSELRIYPFMLPEKVSTNRDNTVFRAPRADKGYIRAQQLFSTPGS